MPIKYSNLHARPDGVQVVHNRAPIRCHRVSVHCTLLVETFQVLRISVMLVRPGEVVYRIVHDVFWVNCLPEISRDAFQGNPLTALVEFSLMAVNRVREGKPESDGGQEHFNAHHEILIASGYCSSRYIVISSDSACLF